MLDRMSCSSWSALCCEVLSCDAMLKLGSLHICLQMPSAKQVQCQRLYL